MKKRLEGPLGKLTRVVTSVKFIVTFAVLVLISTFAVWQYNQTTNTDRVFWGMVENNLQTSSYSRQIQQKNGSQTLNQVIDTNTTPHHEVFSRTVFVQTGVDEARAVTENIGTPTTDYVRYAEAKTAQGLDFSSVLGVWGERGPQEKDKTTGQLYNQSVLGIFPVGNLSASERRDLVKFMKKQAVYSFKKTETKRSPPVGRPTYTLEVTVKPLGYIAAMQKFADYVGLTHMKDINLSDYADAKELTFTVTVDGWTHQMLSTDQGQGRLEAISGRNSRKQPPAIPENAIAIEELEAKLSNIQ